MLLPCFRERRQWSDRTKTIERALFAGYVFCHFVSPVLEKVLTTPGVIRLVGNEHGLLPVPTHQIDALQTIVRTRLAVEPWPSCASASWFGSKPVRFAARRGRVR